VSSGQFADRSGRDVQHAAAASQGCSESVFTFVLLAVLWPFFWDGHCISQASRLLHSADELHAIKVASASCGNSK